MRGRAAVVLDVGKTLSKLSLWVPGGQLLDRRERPNANALPTPYAALDVGGIEAWMTDTLRDFARTADIGAIIPVAHGAAAAIVRDGALVQPPLDYEHPIPPEIRATYDRQRDPFPLTGSPALPNGLNLGAQIHFLESNDRDVLAGNAMLLPWPQYWSWRLSGVASSEVTSLGCHTDLWRPLSSEPSALSVSRGWARRLPPLLHAGAVMGTITREWSRLTGLPQDVEIHCGLHDSNAALLASRAFPDLAANDSTVLSTGTWFVAMRTPGRDTNVDLARLAEKRDCLVNVDAFGKPIPSARFMGGREIERLTASDTSRIDDSIDQAALLQAVPEVLARGTMVLPTGTPGCGPYPDNPGGWLSPPANDFARRAAVCLYAALVADVSLDLIGAKSRLLIEGRFARAEVFTRALASLREGTVVYVDRAQHDASFGALRLVDATLPAPDSFERVEPLPFALSEYRACWREKAGTAA